MDQLQSFKDMPTIAGSRPSDVSKPIAGIQQAATSRPELYQLIEFIPMMTPHSLFVNSSKVDRKQIAESFNRWSKECQDRLNENIEAAITPKWNEVTRNSASIQKEIKTALTEYRRHVKKWQDPTKKKAPSLREAMEALHFAESRGMMIPKGSTNNFIHICIQLKTLVEQLNAMDKLLSQFKCFGLLREKYSERLEQIRKLVMEYSLVTRIHPSIKKCNLELGYALLLSVVPTMLDIIKETVHIICSEIPNQEMTDEEVDNWAKIAKNEFRIEHTVHYKFDIKTEVESYPIDQANEITRLQTLLADQIEENKRQLKERDDAVNKLESYRTDQTNEIMRLKTLLNKRNEEEKCGESEPIDEFDKLLSGCRQRAENSDMKTKLETNYSTSNFAYGVFDSRGGNLSVGDVKLFIPQGAISSTQEVYIYIDPKARFSTENQDKNENVNELETRVAPIVHCGPPGTLFLSHVVLTIPHNAADEEQWKFTPVRAEGDRCTDDWQNIESDEGEDDSIVIVDGGFCIFMVRHFTRFTLIKNVPD